MSIMIENTSRGNVTALPARSVGSLAGIALFRELAPEVVTALSRRCAWRRYAAEQIILQRRDESSDIFFIVSGRVCASYNSASGREVRFNELTIGEMFGEFAAIDGEPRSVDIVSVTDTLIASMSADLFWDVMRRNKSVCAAMLRRLTRIARAQVQRVVEFSTLPVRSRVHAELLRLAQVSAAGQGRTSAAITPAPTHAEIASRISTHREAVTRGPQRARPRAADRAARRHAGHPQHGGAREHGRGDTGGAMRRDRRREREPQERRRRQNHAGEPFRMMRR